MHPNFAFAWRGHSFPHLADTIAGYTRFALAANISPNCSAVCPTLGELVTIMKRIGILTAGGDTPALNATIYGAVLRASQRRVEVFGFIKGFSSLFNPRVPHVHLNPLFSPFPSWTRRRRHHHRRLARLRRRRRQGHARRSRRPAADACKSRG